MMRHQTMMMNNKNLRACWENNRRNMFKQLNLAQRSNLAHKQVKTDWQKAKICSKGPVCSVKSTIKLMNFTKSI